MVGARGFQPPASTSRKHVKLQALRSGPRNNIICWDNGKTIATFTRRGDLQWQVKVRRKGYPVQSRTFMYREDAEKWARGLERELETFGFVDRREAEKNTLRGF